MYVLIGGRPIGRWVSEHMGPVPPPVGYAILANSARFLRGYIWGSTLIGLFNGAVVAAGALVIGVPLAFTIFVVQWLTNYIPMFGAFIGGAFAVLIALGTGGVKDAIWMLIFVLIANGPLQTVVSQFALGASLKLNGLVVLFATTGGAILGGAIGGIFAAPFVKIGVDTYHQLKDAGLFDGWDDGRRPATARRGRPTKRRRPAQRPKPSSLEVLVERHEGVDDQAVEDHHHEPPERQDRPGHEPRDHADHGDDDGRHAPGAQAQSAPRSRRPAARRRRR